ncbi:hypothetical protein [Marivita sp. S2033]|uniref:hypothetical protein n=1 Tax=Marivita sp. S2033 TaxID=3373187 RepID=UPI003981F410
MKRFIAATLIFFAPISAHADTFTDVVKNYVAEFDAAKINDAERARIMEISTQDDLAHGMKVLLVHEVLVEADALRHVDMHAQSFAPFQLSSSN